MGIDWKPALVLCLGLASCGPQLLGPAPGMGPYAPSGRGDVEDAVDGLVVGHRLMAAGEYELALKAYYRSAGTRGFNADVLSALGSANLRLGRLNQAEQMLRRAVGEDELFVPAWNNLGVALMEQGKVAEARNVFQTAYALDSGNSDEIRENLRLAIAKLERSDYSPASDNNDFQLVRRGSGRYLLLSTPL
jgi:Flp pilus assembly protein TadD